MTSRFEGDSHVQREADAAEEARVRREAAADEKAAAIEFVEAPPEEADPAGATHDDDPHDWRRERQERIDQDRDYHEERYR